jgi:hypothetical protein
LRQWVKKESPKCWSDQLIQRSVFFACVVAMDVELRHHSVERSSTDDSFRSPNSFHKAPAAARDCIDVWRVLQGARDIPAWMRESDN